MKSRKTVLRLYWKNRRKHSSYVKQKIYQKSQLFFEYKEVLEEFLKQEIIELVPNFGNKGHVEFYPFY